MRFDATADQAAIRDAVREFVRAELAQDYLDWVQERNRCPEDYVAAGLVVEELATPTSTSRMRRWIRPCDAVDRATGTACGGLLSVHGTPVGAARRRRGTPRACPPSRHRP